MRQQEGYIRKSHGAWYGVWYEDRIINGAVKRVQACRKLADCDDRHRCKKDVRDSLREILEPLNKGKVDVRSTMSLTQFVEQDWIPHCERELRPATVRGYKDVWTRHVKPYIGEMRLRDIQAVTATELLHNLRRQRVGHRTSNTPRPSALQSAHERWPTVSLPVRIRSPWQNCRSARARGQRNRRARSRMFGQCSAY